MTTLKRGLRLDDSPSGRFGRVPWNPPGNLSAPAEALRRHMARLEEEALRIRRRAEELDQTMALVRECLALLPADGPSSPATPPWETQPAGAGEEVPAHVVRSGDSARTSLPPLSAQLLGRFRIYRGGRELQPVAGPKVWRILKYLVLREGGPVSRDVLAETFWRRSSPRRASQSVYSAMHALRQALGGDEGYDYLMCTDGCYSLAAGASLATDIARLRSCVQTARAAVRQGEPEAAVEALEEAVRTYASPLLTDEPYERWAADEREVLARQQLAALEELARLHVAGGQEDRAAECHRLVLDEDPLRESSHRALIRHHLAAGRRADALRQYRTLERTLRKELGVDPDPATRELIAPLVT